MHSEFGEDGYNVFIFGSFLREDYKPLESDLDLAVFCPDKRKSIFIQGYIEDYLNAREIPFDLIEIHLWQKGEFIDISPTNVECWYDRLLSRRFKYLFKDATT